MSRVDMLDGLSLKQLRKYTNFGFFSSVKLNWNTGRLLLENHCEFNLTEEVYSCSFD